MNNLQKVVAIYEAFGRGDVPAILEFLHPDVEWEHDVPPEATSERAPWLAPRRGKAEVPKFFESLADVQIHRFIPETFVDGGRHIFVTIRLGATVRSTGRQLEDFEGHLFTFDAEGRIVRFRHFVDTYRHLTASRV